MTSANTVGYMTEGLTSGKNNMQGVMFTGVDGKDLDLNKDFNFPGLEGGVDETDSDLILTWDPIGNGYTTYFYYNEEGLEEYWGWTDTDWSGISTLPSGTAFWYRAKSGSGKSVTIAGAVESDGDITFDLIGGKNNMCANPYPVSVDLNDKNTIDYTGLEGGVDETDSDLILTWDPIGNGYTTYFYYNEEGLEEYWGWTDTDWSGVNIIPAGAGFWYRAKVGDGKKITFKSPLVK